MTMVKWSKGQWPLSSFLTIGKILGCHEHEHGRIFLTIDEGQNSWEFVAMVVFFDHWPLKNKKSWPWSCYLTIDHEEKVVMVNFLTIDHGANSRVSE